MVDQMTDEQLKYALRNHIMPAVEEWINGIVSNKMHFCYIVLSILLILECMRIVTWIEEKIFEPPTNSKSATSETMLTNSYRGRNQDLNSEYKSFCEWI